MLGYRQNYHEVLSQQPPFQRTKNPCFVGEERGVLS